ncbi:MAG: aminopeptidase P family protein [Lachnospiraceae bacterium]|nr:aminopeptidase P family protein [Lachnospiraceae bacterium]
MASKINMRIEKLRELMAERNMSVYVIPMADFHSSEYVGAYFMEVEFMSGFTGTNATVVVTKDKAGLWTDGRYFIQAKRELDGSCVKLYEMGEEGVPTVNEFIEKELLPNTALGLDGRIFTISIAKEFKEICDKKNCSLSVKEDLVDTIWTDRPSLPEGKVWELGVEHAGKSREEKLSDVRKKMEEYKASGYLLTDLCSIAWLLNLRGDDIPSVPVFLSYIYINEKKATLYINQSILSDEIKDSLSKCNIALKDYDEVYSDLKNISEKRVLIDDSVVNYALLESFNEDVEPVFEVNPTELMKAVKNETEIRDTKNAHVRDGIALTHFIYWVKKAAKTEKLSEVDASNKLLEFRKAQKDFLDVSFDTIAAYGPNAAMMHYSATEEKFSYIEPKGFLLVDSGGHYIDGTTDVTRTIKLGELSEEEMVDYTTVLRCHLRLMDAHFPKGACGQNLDILARGPVWDRGLDYRCGTGHGVGHILNVHEGPNAFRWRIVSKANAWELRPGMITSNEPGLYIEDGYGIRIENEILVKEDVKTEYGQFYSFENLTVAPYDLDAVKTEMLTQYEKETLNRYNRFVYETLSPDFEGEELEWLKNATREI